VDQVLAAFILATEWRGENFTRDDSVSNGTIAGKGDWITLRRSYVDKGCGRRARGKKDN